MTTSVPQPGRGASGSAGGRPTSAHPQVASALADDDPVRALLAQHPTVVAPRLLGAVLTSDIVAVVSVRITEVEAYGGVGEDPGSHAHRRRTERNAAMFGPVGHAYVYFTYGMHWCLNVVAHEPGVAGAVLIRAGEVVEGHSVARARRPTARSDRDLARGPARLAAALGVTGDADGIDLLTTAGPLRLLMPDHPVGAAVGTPGTDTVVGATSTDRAEVAAGTGLARPAHAEGPRTGVAGAGAATPWRFWIPGDPTVSRHRPAGASTRSAQLRGARVGDN